MAQPGHWLTARAAATTIVSAGPGRRSDAKSTAYDTDVVDDRRASGRFTLKTEVTDESSSSPTNREMLPTNAAGKNANGSAAPARTAEPSELRAARGLDRRVGH